MTIQDAVAELTRLSENERIDFQLPTDDLLDEYAQQLGFEFSDDYRYLQKTASNILWGTLSPLRITYKKNGCENLLAVANEAHLLGVPDDWLPICEDNADYFCLLKNGVVRFWSHDSASDESWPDLASWVKDVWIDGN